MARQQSEAMNVDEEASCKTKTSLMLDAETWEHMLNSRYCEQNLKNKEEEKATMRARMIKCKDKHWL